MIHDFSNSLRKRLTLQSESPERVFEEKGELKPGERREIAILFLDLGGFTALSEKLDHEAVHDISKGVMNALVEVTEQFGGYVDKIEGDRIMVLFGARKARENDSTRAVSCGFLMLDAIETANDILSSTGIPITARIGINSGPVTVAPDAIGHLTAMGKTVNLASRLEEAAELNTILVSDTVYEKCSDMFSWEDKGTINLKGISYPVQGWYPTGAVSSFRPRWERVSMVSSSAFVGRSYELSWLRKKLLMQEAGDTEKSRLGGVKHIVLGIKGEAGIGKSRLVHEFIQQECANDDDVLVLRGQTLSYAQPAYCLWISLLRNLIDIERNSKMDYEEFRRRIDILSDDRELMNSAPFLAELLSIRSGDKRLDELDSKAIALETRIAFRNLLNAMADKRRLIVVLDDLHWIDSTCREVLEFIIGNCRTEKPILFLLVYRLEGEDGKRVEFEIRQSYAELEEISISSIEEQACHKIIAKMLAGISVDGTEEVSPKVEDFLIDHSRGNPLFLEELIHDIVESKKLKEIEGQWIFTSPISEIYIPASLTGLLQSRLDRLSEEWKAVLQKTSILGIEFKLQLYNRLVKELAIKEDSRAILNNLERRQFLVGMSTAFEQRYIFRHILIHDTVYNSMLESNRRLLHGITARLIEEMYPDDKRDIADILVHHWERAGERDKAIHWGTVNLEYKVETYQHEKALELSEKLETWITEQPVDMESGEKLLEVLMNRAVTFDLLGRRKEQEQLLLRMKKIADTYKLLTWQGEILSSLGNMFRITGYMNKAEKCYMDALEIHRNSGNRYYEGKVQCNLGILCRIQNRAEEAQEYLEAALEFNREEGDRGIEGIILGNLGNLYFDQERMDKAIEYYSKAREINREVGDRRSEGIALGNLGNPLMVNGEVEQALDYFNQALELHREIGNRKSEGVTLGNLGAAYYENERFDKSRECYEKALEIHLEVENPRFEAITLAALSMLRIKQNNSAGALDYYLKATSIIKELKLTDRGFEKLTELRDALLSIGFSEAEVKWPWS